MTGTVQIQTSQDEYDITGSNTTYQLGYGKYILQTDPGFGIEESVQSHDNTIEVDGAVGATHVSGYGIEINGTGTTVHIGSDGSVQGGYLSIIAYGDNARITNNGILEGDAMLVNSQGSSFTSNGTLHGSMWVSDSDKCNVEFGGNSVSNAKEAIKVSNSTGMTIHITNYGKVIGSESAFVSFDGDETLVNRGTMKGAISFGAGNDTFDNRLGSVDHAIKGGAGNDTFFVDKKIAISEVSGEGTDTLKSTISMNLSTGVLKGQSLENLRLIGMGDIDGTGNGLGNKIIGDHHANRLAGLGGADLLSGGKGHDVLDGGAANDRLSGGLGADTFVFKTGYGHDRITDFDHTADHIDIKAWHAIADFKDMMSHHLTISGDDLVIHAGSDELVLQHTTKSELHASDFSF